MKELQPITSYIKHLAVSGLSKVSARIKSACNLTGKCFEMPNVSYTRPLCVIVKKKKKDRIMVEKHFLEMSLLTKTDYSK